MADFVPAGYLPLKGAVEVMHDRLLDASETGDKAQAIQWLRSFLAEEQVVAIAIAENGQVFQVGAALWLSRDGGEIFRTGLLPVGNLRQSLQARDEGNFYRRILVSEADLETALKGSTRPGRKGRPRGSGSLVEDDKWLVDQMCELIKSGRAGSVHDAACQVADHAKGGGTFDSKVRRLERRYSKFDKK